MTPIPLKRFNSTFKIKPPKANGAGRQKNQPQVKRTLKKRVRRGRKKLPSLTSVRLKAWKEFSIFIRTRNADANGFVYCVTCGKRLHWKEAQAGHWIHGRLDFNQFNINPQCAQCNCWPNTRVNTAYACFMAREYGVAIMESLRLESNQHKKLTRLDYEELRERYAAVNAETFATTTK